MKNMTLVKTILTSLTLIIFSSSINAQSEEDKMVNITVSGYGKSLDEAKDNSLRNAIEQAFGVFVSSNTTILNDSIIKDDIISISNGNIQSYRILNSSTLPDGNSTIIINASVSVSKLLSYSEAKGVEIEFKGGLFTVNIKQQILNERAEVKAIWDMLFVLSPIAFQSFDYTIQNSEPRSLDTENLNWAIPITILSQTNGNIDFLFDYFEKCLSLITLDSGEVATYKSLNKKVYPITFNGTEYYLRKEESRTAIKLFFGSFPDIIRNFTFDDGIKKKIGIEILKGLPHTTPIYDFEKTISPFVNYEQGYHYYSESYNDIKSIKSGTLAGTFKFNDIKTLNELEKLTGYKVIPTYSKSKVGSWRSGGVIIYENDNGGGFIAAFEDMGVANWKLCDNRTATSTSIGAGKLNTQAILNDCTGNLKDKFNHYIAAYLADSSVYLGYSDWFLPSLDELRLVYKQIHFLPNYVNLNSSYRYWSSSDWYNSNYGNFKWVSVINFSVNLYPSSENGRESQVQWFGGTPMIRVPIVREF